jgi:hypothetical protein
VSAGPAVGAGHQGCGGVGFGAFGLNFVADGGVGVAGDGDVRGGTPAEPLCATCTRPEPGFWRSCPGCGQAAQLGSGPCIRCNIDARLRDLLDDGTGDIRPELQSLHHNLRHAEKPDTVLAWLAKNSGAAILRQLTTLELPAVKWAGPQQAIDAESLWEHARRLLHDDTLKPEDRVAGLFVLLYAQWPAAISRLTIDHIDADNHTVRLRLGHEPVDLPEPLASLVLHLVAARQGHVRLGDQRTSGWLFPGGEPRPAHQLLPAHRTAPPTRNPTRTIPVHSTVPTRHRAPRSPARPHARHPHQRRRRLATRQRR